MPEGHEVLDEDEKHLASLGYTQELNRSWSGFSNFAISFSIISILAGCFTSFGLGWNNGGPAAIAWGWPLVSVFILIIGLCMSELVSAYPTSGGIYWWASKLGGAKAGFYTGWLNLIGLIAILASVAYGAATFLDLTLGTFSETWLAGYSLTRTFVLFLVILALSAIINIFSSHLLAVINNISVWWHVAGAAAVILILFLVPEQHASFSDVFAKTVNNSGIFGGDKGIGWLLFVLPISAILTQYTITGYDASAHLSEETKSAADGAAKGIWRSIFYSAIGGWILLLSFLFAVQDFDAVSEGGGAVAVIFTQAMSSPWVGHRAVDLDRGPVLLHDGLPDQRVANAVRVQPRPRGARSPAVVEGEQEQDPRQRRHRDRDARGAHHAARPGQGRHQRRTGADRVLRGGLDRCGRAVPVLRGADLLPVEGRRLVPGRQVESARASQVDGAGRAHRDRRHVDHRDVPDLDRWHAAVARSIIGASDPETPFEWKFVNYTPLLVGTVLILLYIYWHVSVKKWFTGPIKQVELTESGEEIVLDQ